MQEMISILSRNDFGTANLDWIVLLIGAVALAVGTTSIFLGGSDGASETFATVVSERPAGR